MRSHYLAPAQSPSGAIQSGAVVSVYQEGTTDNGAQAGTLIAGTVYADATSSSQLGNPFTASSGEISFYLDAPLRVDLGISISGAGAVYYPDVDVLTPSAAAIDADAGDIQALGSAAVAGAVGLAADAGHVHPWDGLGLAVNSPAWLNVRAAPYGAAGDGATDDTAALQGALTAAGAASPLASVYLPPGVYGTSAPLVVPSGVTLRGDKGNVYDSAHYGAVIYPLSTWGQGSAAQEAVIILGAGTAAASECAVRSLSIDTTGTSVTCDGIDGNGSADNVLLDDVYIYYANSGVNPKGGNTWYGSRVHCYQCYIGFDGWGTDSSWTDCLAEGCSGPGWTTTNAINTTLTACRSEWSAGNGFTVAGTSAATGGVSLVGCSTDRNGSNGIEVSSTGTFPVLISGYQSRRDGASSSSGNYAGLQVDATCTSPVIVDGMTCFPGYNDQGTGTESPEYGIRVVSGATFVQVTNAYLHAITAGVNGTITCTRAVASRTGHWNASGAITVATDAS
jgi:hypothetical protein